MWGRLSLMIITTIFIRQIIQGWWSLIWFNLMNIDFPRCSGESGWWRQWWMKDLEGAGSSCTWAGYWVREWGKGGGGSHIEALHQRLLHQTCLHQICLHQICLHRACLLQRLIFLDYKWPVGWCFPCLLWQFPLCCQDIDLLTHRHIFSWFKCRTPGCHVKVTFTYLVTVIS